MTTMHSYSFNSRIKKRSSSCFEQVDDVNMPLPSSKRYRAELPTEVLYEIFLRLPSLKPAFQFRCVSKLWNSLLSDPSFINHIFKSITSIPWIFMYDPSDQQVQLSLNHNQKFIEHHDGLSFRFLLETEPCKSQSLGKVYLLDSCSNGLVLYSVDSSDASSEFHICNPLTKQWVSLPSRPCDISQEYHHRTKLVCDTSTASLSNSTCNYKVVYIYSDLVNGLMKFQIFSSGSKKWEVFEAPEIGDIWWGIFQMFIHCGVLYWNDTEEKIVTAYNLENKENRCRSVAFPRQSLSGYCKDVFFGESEGSIYYGYFDQQSDYKAFLSVWKLEDDYSDGGLNWQFVHNSIELNGYMASPKVEAIYINPVDRNVIIIVDRGCCLAYNLRTLTHEVLRGCPIPSKIRDHYERPIIITPKPTLIPSIS